MAGRNSGADMSASGAGGLALFGLIGALAAAKGAWWVETYDFFWFVGALMVQVAAYLAAVWLVLKHPGLRGALLVVLFVAVLLRGLALTAPVNLTTDILRYVWDGRMQLHGFNPFMHVPADPALAALQSWDQFNAINQKETSVTIYPPVAEMVFALSALLFDTIEGMRLVMTTFEAVTVYALIGWLSADGLPRERVVIYAWHPLPIWEFSSQAHIDSVAVAFLMLAVLATVRGRQGWAGVALACAVLAKYFPVVLGPALWRRYGWRMPAAFIATIIALYLPYWWGAGPRVLGFLFSYLDNEGYRSGYGFHLIWLLRDFGIGDIPGRAYTAVALVVIAGLCLYTLLARRSDAIVPAHLVVLAAAFVWITSPHYPWYFGWLVPLLVRWLSPSVMLFSLGTLLQNLPGDEADPWLRASTFYLVVFGIPAAAMLAELAWRRRRHARGKRAEISARPAPGSLNA